MKYLFLPSIFFFAVTLSAQHSSVKVNESETDTGYTYSIRSTELTDKTMNTIFSELSDMTVEARVSGEINTQLDDGVSVPVNTRRKRFEISYSGTDEAALAHAKALAADLHDRIQSESHRR